MRVSKVYSLSLLLESIQSAIRTQNNRPTNKANYYRFTKRPEAYSVYIIIYYLGNSSKAYHSKRVDRAWPGESVAFRRTKSCIVEARMQQANTLPFSFSGSEVVHFKVMNGWDVYFLAFLCISIPPPPLFLNQCSLF